MLTTISDIKAMSLDVEDKIRDIQERYRTLSMYDIEVCIGLNTNMGAAAATSECESDLSASLFNSPLPYSSTTFTLLTATYCIGFYFSSHLIYTFIIQV